MRIRRLAALTTGLLLLVAPVLSRTASADTKPVPAPHFTLPTTSGTVDSDSLRGQVVLVDFWASWCGPCQQSFPWLKSMDARFGSKGLRIVAINLDKKRSSAKGFLSKHDPPFTVAFDSPGKIAEAFRVKGMPSSYLIDRQGKILYSHVGFESGKTEELEALIAKACS